jgi:hypothetical protein
LPIAEAGSCASLGVGLQWNHTNCGPANNWCGGFDFSQNGSALLDDLKLFTESWLGGI